MAAAKVARVKKQLSASISELLNAHRKSQMNLHENNGMSSLHQAALMGNMQILRMLIHSNASLDATDAKGMSALHYATLHNTPEIASFLLQSGAKVDIINCDGNSALHMACQQGQIQVISLLLYYRADPTIRNKQGLTPFDCACEFGRTKSVEILLQSGLFKNISNEFDENSKISPLHLAAKNGHIDVLKLLMEVGFDINLCLSQGTALHEASVHGRFEVVKFLLQSGSDPYALNANGQTSLDIVKRQSNHSDPNVHKIKQVLKEAQNAVYGKAICDYCARYDGELSFNYGDIIWIVDRSNDINWKGVIFGPNYSARFGQFPAASVQLIDRTSGMQRSASQRQVKKVNVPVVPDIPGVNGGSGVVPPPPFVTTNLSSSSSRQSSSSYGSWPYVDGCETSTTISNAANGVYDVMKPSQSTNLVGACQVKSTASSCASVINNHHNQNHCGLGRAQQPPTDGGGSVLPSMSSLITMSSPARHRNSTGSNSSQSSSGFESMKSGSQTQTNANSHNFRGDSPPSRNSVHSSGSSSLGSLERLDESGYASQINVAEMALNGIPDNDILSAWLHNLHYEEYIGLFVNAGYDLVTVARMTPEDLTAIGITKPGHRKRLTTEIHKMNILDSWPDKKTETLYEWLQALNLLEYLTQFEAQGYSNMDRVLQLTWEDFEDIGVKKLGHLKKFVCAIKKIKDSRHQRSGTPLDQNCLNGVGEVLLINVPPAQRSTAEIRPYSHLTHGQHSPQTMTTFQQSPQALSASQETLMYRPELVQINSNLSPTQRHHGQNSIFTNGNYAHLTMEANSSGYDTFPPWREKFNGHYATKSPDPLRANYITTEAVVHQIDRPKVTVKPRPVAKIIAKTKRGSRGDVCQQQQQDVIYYQENCVTSSCEDFKSCLPQSPLHKRTVHQQGYVNVDVGGGGCKYEQYESIVYDGRDSTTNCCRPYLQNNTPLLNHKQTNGSTAVNNCSSSNCTPVSPRKTNNTQAQQFKSTKEIPLMPPPKKPPHPQAHIFQLSTHPCLDESFELSPAPSVDEFPPPPYPIMCEEQIRNLRSIKENPPIVDDDCLSQCGDHHSSYAPPPAFSDDHSSTIVRRRVAPDGMAKGNRNDSTASMDSNSSTETLPFANENVGTIKQKNGVGCSSAPASQCATPRRHVSDVFNGVGDLAQKQCNASSNNGMTVATNGGNMLDDMSRMLEELTDQFDAVLCEINQKSPPQTS